MIKLIAATKNDLLNAICNGINIMNQILNDSPDKANRRISTIHLNRLNPDSNNSFAMKRDYLLHP